MVRKNNVLIITLYSAGMIGNLAGLTLAYSPGFELIEQRYNKKFPPVAVIHKNKPLSPIRFYKKTLSKINLYLFLSEISLSMTLAPHLYQYIMKLIDKYKINFVFILSSIGDINYNFITNLDPPPNLSSMTPIKEGAIGGALALLLPKLHEKTKYLAIFAPANSKNTIDIDTTITLLNKFKFIFNEIFNENIEIDTSVLESYKKREVEAEMKIELHKDNKDIYR